tara:strand:- start:250 stop:828 length:579 start_codon:yes stop_codon:yes gene_type:complete
LNNQDYYYQLAVLHQENLEQSFLSSLGINFLSLLYKEIDEDKESVVISERKDNQVIAFVSGTDGIGRIYKNLLLRPHLLIYTLKSVFKSPSKMHKVLELLLNSFLKNKTTNLPNHELLSIVVNPAFQGEGCAEILFNRLCDYFKKKNVKSFKIIVGGNLTRANAFYKKMGAMSIKTIQVHKGVDSTIYIKQI